MLTEPTDAEFRARQPRTFVEDALGAKRGGDISI